MEQEEFGEINTTFEERETTPICFFFCVIEYSNFFPHCETDEGSIESIRKALCEQFDVEISLRVQHLEEIDERIASMMDSIERLDLVWKRSEMKLFLNQEIQQISFLTKKYQRRQ